MLYRPGILPDAAATVQRWRTHFKDAGLGDPYIVMAQAFGDGDPDKYGIDAAAGFPPFWASGKLAKQTPVLLDPNYRGEIFDYGAMADATTESYAIDQDAGRKVFPGVCPNWDNEARKPGRGTCFTGSTPEKYGRWLASACGAAMRAFSADERIVFINAWNEWAEGAYLEPDRHFGYAYLAQTTNVLNGLTELSGAAPRTSTPGLPHAPQPVLPVKPLASRLKRRILNRLAGAADDIAWKLRGN
jgi:lipopolysaccharide biosynthesis protein